MFLRIFFVLRFFLFCRQSSLYWNWGHSFASTRPVPPNTICFQSFIAYQRNWMRGHPSISLLKTWITEKHHKLFSIAFNSVHQASATVKNKAYSIQFGYKPSILVPDAPQIYFLEALNIFYQLPSTKFGAKAQGLDSGMVSCGRRRPRSKEISLCNSKHLFPNNMKQVKVRKKHQDAFYSTAICNIFTRCFL